MTMRMNRKEFLYALGSGAGAIAGWVFIPGCTNLPSPKGRADSHFCPRLAKDVAWRRIPGGGELAEPDEKGTLRVVCRANGYGLKVIEGLNGRNTVQALAEKIHKGFDPAQLEHTEASVASFLATLAQAGLLSEPFFVDLYAAEITA